MNREIKFRVWNGQEMEYDITVGKFGTFYVNPGSNGDGLDENDNASLTPFNTKYPDDIQLMQFTGFKDKNGIEIYEGDILAYERTINFKKELILPKEIKWEDRMINGGVSGWTQFFPINEFVVIGNIHKNPELLKEE